MAEEKAKTEKADIQKPYVIFTPLPQLTAEHKIQEDSMRPLLQDGLLFTLMEPQLRSYLLDVANSANCSDDVLAALVQSEIVFWAQVPPMPSFLEDTGLLFPEFKRSQVPPMPSFLDGMLLIAVTQYSGVAIRILDRIFNCLQVFSLAPPPLNAYCWFYGAGTPGQIDPESIRIANPDWKAIDMPFNLEWKSAPLEPTTIAKGLEIVGLIWERLAPILTIERLKDVFSNNTKHEGYLEAGRAYATKRAKEMAKARSEEIGKTVEPKLEGKIYGDWIIEGYGLALRREVEKLDFAKYEGFRGQRVIRAFQFFSNAHRLPNPHRFVALTTCLEALFSKEPAEVTFQLAARTAWFLEPDDSYKRGEISDDVFSIYKFRSDIVHGRKYNISNLSDDETKLEILVRRALMEVFADDRIYNLIFQKDQKAYNKYLEALSLGQTGTDKTDK